MARHLLKNKMVKNAGWLIASKIVQSILSIVVTVISARCFGPSNYGLVSYAASVVSFVTPIALLGLANIQVQEITNNPEDEGKIVGSSVFMSVISAIFCMAGVTLFSFIANGDELVTTIVVFLYSIMLIFQATELIMYWFQAKYLNKYYAIVSFTAYLLVSIYKIVLLFGGLSVFLYALSNAIDYLIISVALFILYKKKGGKSLVLNKSTMARLFAKSKHFIIPTLMISIFTQTDHIMLKHMINTSATGYYQAAVTCASYANFVFNAIVDVFRPKAFEDYKHSESSFENTIVRLNSIIIYLGLLFGVLMTIFSPLVIDILYGNEYSSAAGALMVVSWFPLFSFLGSSRNIWVLAKDRQKYLWLVNLVGAVANVALNFCLIPLLGIVGAAVASLITQIVANIIFTSMFRPYRHSALLIVKALNPKVLLSMFRKTA